MKLIIFDLDGTLAESKQPIAPSMATRLDALLAGLPVAVISGGALPQLVKQVAAHLSHPERLGNLYLLPTSGASLYEWRPSTTLGTSDNEWKKVYEERISERDAAAITAALETAATESGVVDPKAPVFGEQIEYRGGQVSFSALGQEAPIDVKKEWDPARTKRRKLQEAVTPQLPRGFTAAIGGATSIDVTKDGVDKAYGIRKLCERLRIKESEALYVGDELVPNGNDEVVYETDVKTKSVTQPSDTEKLIDQILPAIAGRGG